MKNKLLFKITRTRFTEFQSIGIANFLLGDDKKVVASFCTLELPWKNNQVGISCIPTGKYDGIFRSSKRFPKSYLVKSKGMEQVEGRTWILIHKGNYFTDILGCILLGENHYDINGDGQLDVVNSTKAMNRFMEISKGQDIDIEIESIKGPKPLLERADTKRNIKHVAPMDYISINATYLNVRNMPSLDNSVVISQVSRPQQFVVLSVSSDSEWVKIQVTNHIGKLMEGWISTRYISYI